MCAHTQSTHCRKFFSSSFKYNLQIQTENLHLKLFINLKNVKIQTSLISISSKSLTQACFFKPNDLSLAPQYTGCHIFMEAPTQPVLVSFSSQCTQNPHPHFPTCILPQSTLPQSILCSAIQVAGVFTVTEQYSREKSFPENPCFFASLRPKTRALQTAQSYKIHCSLFSLEPTPSNFPVMHFSHFLAPFHPQVNLFLLNPPPFFPLSPLSLLKTRSIFFCCGL